MQPRRNLTLLVMSSALVLALAGAALASPPGNGGQSGGDRVPVIVVFEDTVQDARQAARDLAQRHDAELSFVYEHALKGFAADVPQGRIANLERDHRVDYVETDRPVQTQVRPVPTGIDRVDAEANSEIDIDGSDDQRVDVDVAVLDTGIDLDHPDLNVVGGVTCLEHSGGPPWQREYSCVDGGDDGHGHGTHVSGTVAALDDGTNVDGIDVVGVAPGARLHAVKVLDDQGSGTTGSVIAGIDWVTANAVGNNGPIRVANMSLGGSGESSSMDDALKGSYTAGVAYAVAAGNSGADVDGYHPAGSPWVLTVSALADFDGKTGGKAASTCREDEDDTFASFSNYGETAGQDVDVIAPGVCILSTYPGGGYRDGYSGTSMASPHVAGAAALLASNGASATDIVGDVTNQDVDGDGTIETNGGTDWDAADDPDDTQEPLADVGNDTVFAPALVAGPEGSTDGAPSVTLTDPGDGATVSGEVSVTADASDDDSVDQVEFFVDDTFIGSDSDGTDSDGWSTSWDTTSVTEGDHIVTATATDTTGQTASDSVTVTVDNVDDPPSVTITNPAHGATVSGTVDVTANASDDRGVSKVEFFVDGSSIGIDSDSSGGWSTSWDTTSVTEGDHTVTATATDSGDQTDTDSITVTVATGAMHVGDLDSASINNGSSWTPRVIVTVHDGNHNPVEGATVSGMWSDGASGTGSCTSPTGSDGTCEILYETQFHKSTSSVTFTVEGVDHADLTYEGSLNHDPDGDSDGTTITVTKP